MKNRLPACFLMAALIAPAAAQADPLDLSRAVAVHSTQAGSMSVRQLPPQRDSLWNGILIGAGIGALAGMVLAPPAFCGRNDGECGAIVRVAIGLPAIGAGIGLGALVDGLKKSETHAPSPSPARPFAGGAAAHVNFSF